MSTRDGSLLQADLLIDAEVPAEPVPPSDGLRARVLGTATGRGALASYARRFAEMFDLPMARAHELLGFAPHAHEAPWEPAPLTRTRTAEGTRLLHFAGGPRVANADCGLVSVEAGVHFPEHLHEGDEWALVLSGAAEELGSGATWLPGDLVHRPAGSRHAFRATGREPFVFAVILEARIRVVDRDAAR